MNTATEYATGGYKPIEMDDDGLRSYVTSMAWDVHFLDLSRHTKITNDGLRHLERSPSLRRLICPPQIGDLGLHFIAKSNVTQLFLDGCDITSDGLLHLEDMNLEELGLCNTDVSRCAIDEFKAAVPGCKVYV